MRRLALALTLTLVAGAALAKVEPTPAAIPPRTALERAQEPTLDALLQQVVDAVKQTGFTNVGVLPMFVVSATDANGKRVLLLINPETMHAIEVKDEDETASSRR